MPVPTPAAGTRSFDPIEREGIVTDTTQVFLGALKKEGFDFFCGVPCSLLKTLIAAFDHDASWGYVSAVREDSAIGLAVGAYMGGKRPAIFMQNSGLGVSVNALASLSRMYDCPQLLVISWRGEGGDDGVPVASTSKAGFVDAPEHIQMGNITPRLLDLMEIPWRLLDPAHAGAQLAELTKVMVKTKKPVALLVRKGIFDGGGH
jgi:phosphonopyruvate decarboxylase